MALVAGRANHRVMRQRVVVLRGLGLTSKLDVIISELANLNVVDTKNFLLLGGAEPESREPGAQEAKSTEDNAGTTEGVGTASNRVSNLVAKLDPVVVQPAAVNLSGTIEVGNVITVLMSKLKSVVV